MCITHLDTGCGIHIFTECVQGTLQKGGVLYTLKSGVVRNTGLGHHFRCATPATVLRVCVIGSAVHWVFAILNIAFGALLL